MKYLSVEGTKSGKVKGGCTQKGREGTSLIHEVKWHVETPTDKNNGMAANRRSHGLFEVVAEIDEASPIFAQIAWNNEICKTVTMLFWKIGTMEKGLGEGKEVNYYKIILNNARIAKYEFYTPDEHETSSKVDEARWELNRLHFAYQKITHTHVIGSKESSDDWAAPPA